VKEYEVDSVVEMGDGHKVIRKDPVFPDPLAAQVFAEGLSAYGTPAWVEEVEVTPCTE